MPGTAAMDIDTDKIDEAVLALLYLTLHDGFRAWKGFDWDAMDRLYRKGLIHDPVGKVKSVVLTEEGLAESERLFTRLFARPRRRISPHRQLPGQGDEAAAAAC